MPRARLSDAVAHKLEAQITAGEYPVGAKLMPEHDLAQQYGVGRSSMREAVRALEVAGYLRSTHGVGVFVINDHPRSAGVFDQVLTGGYTMSDLFEARIAVESKTAELAARRLTDHHRELIQSILAAASDPDISHERFVELDGRFHRQVAEASGNPLLLHIWESLAAQFVEYSNKVITLPGRLERAHRDHCAIAEAIVARDGDKASTAAREHVSAVQRELQHESAPA